MSVMRVFRRLRSFLVRPGGPVPDMCLYKGHAALSYRGSPPGEALTQPVRTSAWVSVWQRSRNGPSGRSPKLKQPTSSIGTATICPDRDSSSAVPGCGGTSWPNNESSVISTPIEKCADSNVIARIDADSDRTPEGCPASSSESCNARQLGIDAVPGVGVPPCLDERGGYRRPGRDRCAERGEQRGLVQAVIHVDRLP